MTTNRSGIDHLLEANAEHSRIFRDPTTANRRRLYRVQHPTEIGASKCMDGRLHLPVITETELGIINPWRNLGGKFNLGWIGYQQTINGWVEYAMSKGRHCLKLVTYHYSRGDKHRGCRGFNYDLDQARVVTQNLKRQFDDSFGTSVVHTVQCGIETDLESLILHGDRGEIVDLAELGSPSREELEKLLRDLYPEMPDIVRNDFLPLLEGNIRHIAKIRASNRPIADAEHKEWVLALGRGFDWLHELNTALIVGPFDPNLASPIMTAGQLLLDNIKSRRVMGRDIVLMTSAPYRHTAGSEPRLAEQKARFLSTFAREVFEKNVPEIVPYLRKLTGIVDMNTRQFNVLERD